MKVEYMADQCQMGHWHQDKHTMCTLVKRTSRDSTKRSRIISLKVPPLYHTEVDGIEYTLMDWLEDVKRWCVIAEVEAYRQGPLLSLAIDGIAGQYARLIPDEILIAGEVQDWNDGRGPIHRSGVEIILKLVVGLNPPNAQAIQLNAVNAWRQFHRRENETTRATVNRLRLVIHDCEEKGRYPIAPIQRAEKLTQIFQLTDEQWSTYMRPYGGRLPETIQELAILENELQRDFELKESRKPGAVVTPLTALRKQGHAHFAEQSPMDADQQAIALAPSFPVHFQDQRSPYPMRDETSAYMAAGHNSFPNHYEYNAASSSSAYPTQHQNDDWTLPDFDDDDDVSYESTEGSNEDTWAREERADPTPSNPIELAADLGMPRDTDPDTLLREAHFKFRRSHRTYRKAAGKPYPRRTGRTKRHYFKRQFRRPKGKGKGKGKRRRGFYMIDDQYGEPQAYWIDLEHVPEAVVETYFGRKGGSKGKQGMNPIGKDGKRMRCFKCDSETHLERACPQGGSSHFSMSDSYHSGQHSHAHVIMPQAYPTLQAHAGLSSEPHREAEMPALPEEVEEPVSIFGGMDPSFQLILRRHGYQATPEEPAQTIVSRSYVVFTEDVPEKEPLDHKCKEGCLGPL